jgi:hypothetical protein
MTYRTKSSSSAKPNELTIDIPLADRMSITHETLQDGVVIIGEATSRPAELALFPIAKSFITATLDRTGNLLVRTETLFHLRYRRK